MAMTTHTLKTWPTFYEAVLDGRKTFEVRRGNDRTYQVGDLLDLQEWDPETKAFTGRRLLRRITYVMHGAPILPDDCWVMGIVAPEEAGR